MRRDIEATERALRTEQNSEVTAGLQQGMALAQKRLKQHQSIEASYRLLSVKLDTLDKSFRYLESHVVAISEREELSQEIDELILGVDAVSEVGGEMESTLKEIGKVDAAITMRKTTAAAAQRRVKS